MADRLSAVFEAIRESASRGIWSRGVALARSSGIACEDEGDDELRIRVPSGGRLVPPIVSLFPEDLDWACECSSTEDVCEHVVAAVIAARRAEEGGEELLSTVETVGRLDYRLSVERGAVSLERVVVRGDEEAPLETSLVAVARGRVDGPSGLARPHDLEIERLLGSWRRGALPRGVLPRLLEPLGRAEHLKLDGERVGASAEPLIAALVVEDHGEGFRLRLALEERVSRRVADGVVLADGVLRPLAETPLTAREREDLAGGQVFAESRAAEIVTQILPAYSGRLPIEIRTRRLPRTSRQKPRVQVDVRREGPALQLLATIVYGDPPTARIDGERLVHLGGDVPERDPDEERRLRRRLARLGLFPGRRIEIAAAEAIDVVDRLDELGIERVGESLEGFFIAPALAPRVSLLGDRLEVSFESRSDAGERTSARRWRARADAVFAAWGRGESLVPLLGGGWAPLPVAWLARHGDRVLELLDARDGEGRVSPACAPQLVALCDDLDLPIPERAERLREALSALDLESAADAKLPEDLRTTLRCYQRAGVGWLLSLRRAGLGALLADDMGLGKTIQALCAVEGRTLVVCPTSVLHNWRDEISRFRPALRVSFYHGPRREIDTAADVTLTSYALLRLDAERLAAVDWQTVVLDEAQAIKNPESQVAQAAFRLRAAFRISLSGTPVENRLDELWSQLHFTNPGLLGSRRGFDERYARPIALGDEASAALLRRRIAPFVLRRLKRDVAPELPPRSEMELYCVLSEEERATYDAIRAATRRDVLERLHAGQGVFQALEALLRLRQAACHRALVPGESAESSSKTEVLVGRLEQVVADEHRALVFSQWTAMLDLIEPHLRQAGIRFLRLDGQTRDRSGVVERFQDPSEPYALLLISLRAGGTGLNLTAADHVFIVDPWWNPAVEDQAADRAHRIGQERPVFVHRLVAEDTVEERILALQESKRAISDAALGEAGAAASLTRDDLLALLS